MSIAINKQIQTERGLIFLTETFSTEAECRNAGYSYAFYSTKLGCELWSKTLDGRGHRHEFAVVGGDLSDLA